MPDRGAPKEGCRYGDHGLTPANLPCPVGAGRGFRKAREGEETLFVKLKINPGILLERR